MYASGRAPAPTSNVIEFNEAVEIPDRVPSPGRYVFKIFNEGPDRYDRRFDRDKRRLSRRRGNRSRSAVRDNLEWSA